MIFFTFLHSWNFVSCFIWLFTSLLSSVARLKLYFSLKIPFSPKNFCRLLYVSPLEKKTLYLYPLPYILKYCIISTQYLALAHTSTTEPCSTPVPTLALYLLLHLYSSLSSLYIFIFLLLWLLLTILYRCYLATAFYYVIVVHDESEGSRRISETPRFCRVQQSASES